MNDNQRINAIKQFIGNWNRRGSEKSDAHLFWLELLTALGLKNPTQAVEFEREIDVDGHKCFIDVLIPSTRVLIEQKSRGIDLDKPAHQSDGKFLTPFEQAKRYADALPRRKQPDWIVVSNFDEFRIYDMDRVPSSINANRKTEPQIIKFKHLLPDNYRRLNFLVDPNDENIDAIGINKDAVRILAVLRRLFAKKILAPRRFKDKDDPVAFLNPAQQNLLNKFIVRLVFCFYAEDAALFNPNQFVDYLLHASDYGRALFDLFKVLNTPCDRRPPDLPSELNAFKYVNGGLFDDDALELPPFDSNIAQSISLHSREDQFNWFAIDPTIFGALFESDLNADVRRKGGMHYTSRHNILKLIKPLFLDALHDEFDAIKRKRKNKRRALEDFQDKLASLTFLDPACGSGNFLTETYMQLRALENDVIDELLKLNAACTIKVSIDQFYGIEINDFACAIAQIALWISESKMYYDTDVGIRDKIEPLPLKHSARIVCGNALRLDWHELVPSGVDYIIGNPPFSGARLMSVDNKNDLLTLFDGWKNAGNLDFVACWFKKAADFMSKSNDPIRAALVATNSICQGETVGVLWRKLFETVHIDFAWRTFKWISDSEGMAAVHCVIVGLSAAPNDKPKIIFDGDEKIVAKNINAYLIDAPNVFVESRAKPLCNVPTITMGSMPNDGGNLIIEADEYEYFARWEPRAKKFIRRYFGSEEFINGKPRWCLWLVDATEDDLRLPLIAERVEGCRQHRLASKRTATNRLANTPALFGENRQPSTDFIVVPVVSSERRKYIPIGFMKPNVIANAQVQIMPDADLFHFGVLTSSVHMAWMRTVCGRLKSDYRYSGTLVYNNYVWCGRTALIEETAQRILDARALYPAWTLAGLYDEEKMPLELRAAHEANDRAVMLAYGFDLSMTESEIVSRLMEMYQHLTTRASADKIAN